MSTTVFSNGEDMFENNIFSSSEWSAPIMVSPQEIRERISDFKLCGKKLCDMKFIGLDYAHTRERIESIAYDQLGELSEDERQAQSNYESIEPTMKFSRYALIDEPLLIKFEDGDIFEIDTPRSPEYRMSMNCIPWWIDAGTNPPNAHACLLFEPCIDQTIVEVEVNTCTIDKDPMFYKEFDEEPYKREIVSDIVLRLENGCGIRISPWIDFCTVECIDGQNGVCEMDFAFLSDMLFNHEDIRVDKSSGFEARSPLIFLGEKGKDCVSSPFLPLSPSGAKDSAMYIYQFDFTVLDWSITHIIGCSFDNCTVYEFSYEEWFSVLEEALRLLSFNTFDELFDEAIGWSIYSGEHNCMLYRLNHHGEELWNKREQYRILVEDIIEWSRLVLKETDTMRILGI